MEKVIYLRRDLNRTTLVKNYWAFFSRNKFNSRYLLISTTLHTAGVEYKLGEETIIDLKNQNDIERYKNKAVFSLMVLKKI